MDVEKASREVMDLFIRLVNRYNSLERIPVKHGAKHDLYHSERHMLDKIGDNPGMNVSELARVVGVTKGAISQVVKKLETKGAVQRYRRSNNDKEVFVELTKVGRELYGKHKAINEETVSSLCKELERYSDDKIEFLVSMFQWIDTFLDLNRKKMKGHAQMRR
jgi:DNA-binding MarR family transcriptional regulator